MTTFAYVPGDVPENDHPELVRFLREEFWRIKQALIGGSAVLATHLTGTTGVGAGSVSTVAHGLDATKIISMQVLVRSTFGAGNTRVPPDSGHPAIASEYHATFDAANVNLQNHATNGANIYSCPFTVLLMHTE